MEEKVLDILERICEDSVVREDRDVDLFETGLLDSLGFVELLVDLEDALGIVISPSETDRSQLNTPNKLLAFLKERC
ncbi:MAG: D-alanine--poly(phosphoribitol) ligase subunit DltC [Massiliimalia sp.]